MIERMREFYYGRMMTTASLLVAVASVFVAAASLVVALIALAVSIKGTAGANGDVWSHFFAAVGERDFVLRNVADYKFFVVSHQGVCDGAEYGLKGLNRFFGCLLG